MEWKFVEASQVKKKSVQKRYGSPLLNGQYIEGHCGLEIYPLENESIIYHAGDFGSFPLDLNVLTMILERFKRERDVPDADL